VKVFKLSSFGFMILLCSGCSSDVVITPAEKPVYKPMPDITQSVTPSQQRAIMAGERPDWTDRAPVTTTRRY